MFVHFLEIHLPLSGLIVFVVFLLAFLYQSYFYLRYMAATKAYRKKEEKGKIDFLSSKPPVSVVICAKNEEDNLRKNLPEVLEQDYPEFEVIVVNDASNDETDRVLEELKSRYPQLRSTFIPEGTRNLSTKKLGITLAVKAAKYDLLLFTDADCRPSDKGWIKAMMRNFTPGTEIVLGYGAYATEDSFLNRMITYDTLFIALQYLGMAIRKHPYMGVGRNLAYRKELFIRENGFSDSLHLISGDDDLFVNKAGNSQNTRVEVTPESITFSEAKKTFATWLYQKIRHISVSNNYTASSKRRLLAEPITRGLCYLLLPVIFFTGNSLIILSAVTLFILRSILQLLIINKASGYFGGHKYGFNLMLFDILLPVINLYILVAKRPFSEKGKITKWNL